jgi:hypothetical protein
MDVCLLWVFCVVRYRSLRRADHSSRGVLPTVLRSCVWSRNLKNEEAIICVGSQRHRKKYIFCHLKDSILNCFILSELPECNSLLLTTPWPYNMPCPVWFHHRNDAHRGVTFLCADDNYSLLDPDILISILVVKHQQGWEIWPKFPAYTKLQVDKTIV